jgi:murein DD-endopeptidase MepM/ murein hydrolase activator NlpD
LTDHILEVQEVTGTLKRKLLIYALTLGLTISMGVSGVSYAEGSSSKKLEQEKEKLEELQQEKEKKDNQLEQTESQKEELDKKIAEIEKSVAEYDEKMNQKNAEMVKHQKALAQQQEKFGRTIRRLYQQGEMGYMSQLLAADSFGEFLNRFESLRLIVKEDNAVVKKYQDTVNAINKEKADLEKLKQKQAPLLEKTRKEMEQVKKELENVKSDVDKLEGDIALSKEEIEDLKKLTSRGSGTGSGFRWPSASKRVFWNFGQNRGDHIHEGIDIPGSIGTPIYAMASGTVVKVKSNPGGYGWYFVIDHGNGLSTLYAHSYRDQILVSVGQRVSAGQQVSSIGNAGRSSGPHLHFEVHVNGSPVNPARYVKP